mgnify:CR=1 FL=1
MGMARWPYGYHTFGPRKGLRRFAIPEGSEGEQASEDEEDATPGQDYAAEQAANALPLDASSRYATSLLIWKMCLHVDPSSPQTRKVAHGADERPAKRRRVDEPAVVNAPESPGGPEDLAPNGPESIPGQMSDRLQLLLSLMHVARAFQQVEPSVAEVIEVPPTPWFLDSEQWCFLQALAGNYCPATTVGSVSWEDVQNLNVTGHAQRE